MAVKGRGEGGEVLYANTSKREMATSTRVMMSPWNRRM